MTTSDFFRYLRDRKYSPQGFETGNAAYDRFLAGAMQWKADFRLLEGTGRADRSILEREMPFLLQMEEEPAETLGQAMLINAYAMRRQGYGWIDAGSKLSGACAIFYDFTRALPHARLSADDAEALLREIPEALMEDELQLFEGLFLKSFPHDAPAHLHEALSAFLERFFDFDILVYPHAKAIIARHERLWVHLGRDPLDLPFYRERARVFDLARKQSARFMAPLGPVHTRFATADRGDALTLPPALRDAFQAELAAASPAARGQMIADACRVRLRRDTWADASRWLLAGVPFLAHHLCMPPADLVAQLRLPMELTEEQACTILEFMVLHGSRYYANYPMLDDELAARLARFLPAGRADLERLVKETGHETDQPAKDVLIEALRGEKPGLLARLLRRFVRRGSRPQNRPERWDDWIDGKRKMLVTQMATRAPLGLAAPQSAQARDWGGVRGQVYDLDVVGYAKRVALAQSKGAQIATWLDDLRSLAATIRANLAVLEAADAPADGALAGAAMDGLAGGTGAGAQPPSLFGLWGSPTPGQLVACENRTLAALDRLIARIELCARHPGLMLLEARMWDMTKGQDFGSFNLTLFIRQIERAMRDGIPDGLFERLGSFDFALLGGPYIVDTEPGFSEWEVGAWRSSIQALAALPQEIAGPRLEAVAETVFAAEFDPDRSDETFAPRGYRQEALGNAVIRTLMAMSEKTGVATLVRLQARAKTKKLQDRFQDAIQTIGYKPRDSDLPQWPLNEPRDTL
jgi:hypothetical protein